MHRKRVPYSLATNTKPYVEEKMRASVNYVSLNTLSLWDCKDDFKEGGLQEKAQC